MENAHTTPLLHVIPDLHRPIGIPETGQGMIAPLGDQLLPRDVHHKCLASILDNLDVTGLLEAADALSTFTHQWTNDIS